MARQLVFADDARIQGVNSSFQPRQILAANSENEGIEISDYSSSNLMQKDSYDKITVKFPYSLKTLDIQIIFDNIDYSLPPDFLFIKENNFFVDYHEVVKYWNFKESSALFNCLNKIKEIYARKQESIFHEESQNINLFLDDGNYDSNLEIVLTIESINEIINFIKSKFLSFKLKKNPQIEMVLNYVSHMNSPSNMSLADNMKNSVIISYPLDICIRSRNIVQHPMVNISVPITKEGTFYMTLQSPHYISTKDSQTFQEEFFYLKDFESHINKFEKNIL